MRVYEKETKSGRLIGHSLLRTAAKTGEQPEVFRSLLIHLSLGCFVKSGPRFTPLCFACFFCRISGSVPWPEMGRLRTISLLQPFWKGAKHVVILVTLAQKACLVGQLFEVPSAAHGFVASTNLSLTKGGEHKHYNKQKTAQTKSTRAPFSGQASTQWRLRYVKPPPFWAESLAV